MKNLELLIIIMKSLNLFNSGEGGLIITKDSNLSKDMSFMRNFGHNSPETFYNLGINGKNSELHAAMGLINLRYINDIHLKRKLLSSRYDENLKDFNELKNYLKKKDLQRLCEYIETPVKKGKRKQDKP